MEEHSFTSQEIDSFRQWHMWFVNKEWDKITVPTGRPEMVLIAITKLVCVDPFTDAVAAAMERVDPRPLMTRMYQLVRYDASVSCFRWYVERLPPVLSHEEGDDYLMIVGESIPLLFHILYYNRETALDMIDLLFAHGVDPNEQAFHGMTAVIWWVTVHIRRWREGQLLGDRMNVVRRLLEAGCDPLLEDREGRTVFDYVAYIEEEVKRLGTWTEVVEECRVLVALLREWA